MQEIPPFTLAFLRFMIAALLILPFIYKKIAIRKSDFFPVLMLAFVGITMHIALFFLGLQLTSSINVPIINAITPIFLMVGSVWYLHEKLKKKVIFGTALSLLGIILIIVEPLLITGPDGSVIGNLMLLLSFSCVVIYTLFLKKLNLPYSTITLVFWTFFLGALLFIPAFLTELVLLQPFPQFDSKALIGISYGAIFSSALAYFCYDFGLTHLKGSEIGIFAYLEPFITVLVAMPLLGEQITPFYVFGAIIVFAGIFITEAHFHYHPHHPLSRKPN